jgi:hypothetical protein
MSTHVEQALRRQVSAARVAICALLGALEKVRDLVAGGYFHEAKAHADEALVDADAYLQLVDTADGNGGNPT